MCLFAKFYIDFIKLPNKSVKILTNIFDRQCRAI